MNNNTWNQVKSTPTTTVFTSRTDGPAGTDTQFLQVRLTVLTDTGWKGLNLPGRLVPTGTAWNA